MKLDSNQIRELIKERKKSNVIAKAISHQDRLRFHCDCNLEKKTASKPLNDFLDFAKNLLPADKYESFVNLFRFPICTNEIADYCFNKLYRIFNGRNPIFQYLFTDATDKDDWAFYKNKIGGNEVWKSAGWKHFRTDINSFLVIDLPTEREDTTDNKPQPYFYFLPISCVIDWGKTRNGEVDYIIFESNEKICAYDSEYYRVYEKENGNIGNLAIENKHDLGYCPATEFWKDDISLEDAGVKKSPVTEQLENLDWYLFFNISKRHLDLFGAYPILSGIVAKCDYSDGENYCDGNGHLKNHENKYLYDKNGLMVSCPRCGKHRIYGAGTFVEIDAPEVGGVDLRNPVQMLTIDRSSLDYNVNEANRLRNNIIESVCGTESEQLKEAINESQVKANNESQQTKLMRIKLGFELAQKFVEETICRLRYGANFVSCAINYGTEFFLDNASELRAEYKEAKESGASQGELEALHKQIIESEYRFNDNAKDRIAILNALEPLQGLSFDELMKLRDGDLVSDVDFEMKINFLSFVQRFERENIDIVEFASAIDFSKKIETIKNIFIDYAKQNIAERGSGVVAD